MELDGVDGGHEMAGACTADLAEEIGGGGAKEIDVGAVEHGC